MQILRNRSLWLLKYCGVKSGPNLIIHDTLYFIILFDVSKLNWPNDSHVEKLNCAFQCFPIFKKLVESTAYWGPNLMPMMDFFAKIVNGL